MAAAGKRRRPPWPASHPRYWPSWLLAGLMWLLARLPFPAQRALGRRLGDLVRRLGGRRRRIAAVNLALCFPELNPTRREALLRAHFRAAGISVLETAVAWFRDPRDYADRLDLQGLENLQTALAADRGLILAGCHFVTLEICGALLSTVADLDVMYRPSRDPVIDRIQRTGRSRRYGAVIERSDLRKAVRRLRAGRALWYATDQDYGPKHSLFAPFFGVPTATLTATSRLARLTGAQVLRVDHWRDDARMRWTLRFSAPLADFPGPDPETDARRLSVAVEDAVREHPAQYLWLHRRFKTRPPGEPDPYR